jgi:hypothetical protein
MENEQKMKNMIDGVSVEQKERWVSNEKIYPKQNLDTTVEFMFNSL